MRLSVLFAGAFAALAIISIATAAEPTGRVHICRKEPGGDDWRGKPIAMPAGLIFNGVLAKDPTAGAPSVTLIEPATIGAKTSCVDAAARGDTAIKATDHGLAFVPSMFNHRIWTAPVVARAISDFR